MPKKDVVKMGASLDEIRAAASRAGGSPPPQISVPQERSAIVDPTQPGMVQGVGAAYAANQQIAGAKGLSEATVQGLEAMQSEQRKRELEEQEKERKKREAEEAAAKEDNEQRAELGGVDWESLGTIVNSHPMLEAGVREFIESQLQEIPIGELIMGRARQNVPVIPGELIVTLQTVTAGEDLLIKRLLRQDLEQSLQYYDDKKAVLNLAIGVHSINGEPLPELLDPKTGRATQETLMKRFDALCELTVQLIGILAINYNWFDLRVKRRLTPATVKNGSRPQRDGQP